LALDEAQPRDTGGRISLCTAKGEQQRQADGTGTESVPKMGDQHRDSFLIDSLLLSVDKVR
jgi:hypothetical protein